MKKFQLLENIIGIVGIVFLAGVSISSVLSLNPSVIGVPSGVVAGVVKEDEPTNSVIGSVIKIPGTIRYEEFDGIYTFYFDDLKDIKSFPFVTLTNFTKSKGLVRVEANYPKNLENILRIELVDNIDRLILTSPILGNNQRKITVPSQSSREFLLEISSEENINFPFEIQISLL
jgi:hypothetical protein